MVKIYSEKIKSDFEGTIIDLETNGEFLNYEDSRRFKDHIPIIFGFINKNELKILCAKKQDSISKLKKEIIRLLPTLQKPFYAFNSLFEKGVLFHQINKEIEFERELNLEQFESKRRAVRELNLSQYDDPCNDNGYLCTQLWLKGEIDKAMSHNRSCLLKERDILLKRGFRKPDKLKLIK